MHDLWCQILHPSQHGPPHDHVTGLSHSPHGFIVLFLRVGPGFDCMSPAISKASFNTVWR